METIEINLYAFDELSDEAKERAREWWRESLDYPWWSEAHESIRAFLDHFGVEMRDWSMGERGRDYIKTNANKGNFRGRKLRDYSRDYMPTGYCLDCDLWGTFHDEWEATSDPMYAFQQALEAALSAIASDVEYQFTDEAVDESLRINSYQFTEDGRLYR
jgi:hypothetical protein